MILSSKELQIGQFVKSRAGRDKDKLFIIVGIVDDQYVQIADGDLRKLEKPKLKKVRHLKLLNLKSEAVVIAMASNTNTLDALLRKEVMIADLSSTKEG